MTNAIIDLAEEGKLNVNCENCFFSEHVIQSLKDVKEDYIQMKNKINGQTERIKELEAQLLEYKKSSIVAHVDDEKRFKAL